MVGELAAAIIGGNKLAGAVKTIKNNVDRTHKNLSKINAPNKPNFKKKVSTMPKTNAPKGPTNVPDGIRNSVRNRNPVSTPKLPKKKDIGMPKKPGGNILSPDAVRKLGEMGFKA